MARINGIDQDIFPLNLGGNPFGWTSDEAQTHRVLDAFVAGGGNFVDTADVYSQWVDGHVGGESERVLGSWLASRGNRADVVVATKVGQLEGHLGLGRDNVRAALTNSLERLGTDHVDLYYAHRDDPETPIADQVRTFDELVREGSVRAIGLSNYSGARLREWVDTARDLGATLPAAVQNRYSLVARAEYEQDTAGVVAEFGLASFPYTALASGFLTGKVRSAEDLSKSSRSGATQKYLEAGGLAVVEALDTVAAAHDAELSTVALAWLLAKGVTAPIASVSRVEQLPALMAAPALVLTEGEVATLDAASARFA